ncbi:hypothetical protein [Nonomuraea jiangxiensis]|uniref:hypothetical protein n=1 Tax=Nonomuraea jiangxiensis TaxID=633440 RepID=UPI000B86CF01|nr:hypothetical protein [Nonomuraea jiangxiensis]
MDVAWRAGPRDILCAVILNLLGGIFTAFWLLATTGVLTALFTAGPTLDRVQAALPSLALVAAAATMRASVQAGAGWTQSRLTPQISYRRGAVVTHADAAHRRHHHVPRTHACLPVLRRGLPLAQGRGQGGKARAGTRAGTPRASGRPTGFDVPGLAQSQAGQICAAVRQTRWARVRGSGRRSR